MQLDEFKTVAQRHFTDGLVVVVGSGLSCAEGIPGMAALAEHLASTFESQLADVVLAEWQRAAPVIKSEGLEAALLRFPPSEQLDDKIAVEVARFLIPFEEQIVADVLAGSRRLRLSSLVPHLTEEAEGLPVLTTNYDRLVELACETAGLHVDTAFDGSFVGRPDETECRHNMLRWVGHQGKFIRRRWRKHARIFKPHGSFDWYQGPNGPIRYLGTAPSARLIITPGGRKYRQGYEQPFDRHRESVNRLIDGAARFLIVGYGFNDDHLQSRLASKVRAGAPTLILSRTLSNPALEIARSSRSTIAVDRNDDATSRLVSNGSEVVLDRPDLWDLGAFVEEVFAT